MSKKSYIHKKRIVFTALSPYFKGEKLMQAMVVWDKKYSHAPATSVQKFVYDLKNNVDASADTRSAHLSLIRTNSLAESELLPDPSAEIDKYSRSNNLSESAEFSLPQLDALQAFTVLWLDQLNLKHKQWVMDYIGEHINRVKIDPTLALSFIRWLNNNRQLMQLSNANESDLREIVNLIYSASCEQIGPVEADQMLGRVVNEVKRVNADMHLIVTEQLL